MVFSVDLLGSIIEQRLRAIDDGSSDCNRSAPPRRARYDRHPGADNHSYIAFT
jgi:hypothetical protein